MVLKGGVIGKELESRPWPLRGCGRAIRLAQRGQNNNRTRESDQARGLTWKNSTGYVPAVIEALSFAPPRKMAAWEKLIADKTQFQPLNLGIWDPRDPSESPRENSSVSAALVLPLFLFPWGEIMREPPWARSPLVSVTKYLLSCRPLPGFCPHSNDGN